MIEGIDFRNRRGEKLDTAFHPGSRGGRLVVIGHGVTANKDRPLLKAVAEGLAARGWPCLRFSFSGNGDSEGDFRESNVSKECADLADLVDQLPAELELAYIGHSMGGAVGVLSAGSIPRIRVLATLAGMMRTADFAEREFGEVTPDEGCMWDEPDCPLSSDFMQDLGSIGEVVSRVADLRQPLLLIHGTADDVVPPSDSEEAFAAAGEPKRLVRVDGAGHMFGDDSYEQVVTALDEWFGEHFA